MLIRAPRAEDGQAFYEAVQETPDLKLWIPFAIPELPDFERSVQLCQKGQTDFQLKTAFRYHVFHREGPFLGGISIPRFNWPHRIFEIGYWIRSTAGGKGFVTEMVQSLTQYVFDHLQARRIEIKCNSSNLKSRAIPEKLGFVSEGIARNADTSSSNLVKVRDQITYSMTESSSLNRIQISV
jgi:RimJ/RimL family protein N-acetyltransferase